MEISRTKECKNSIQRCKDSPSTGGRNHKITRESIEGGEMKEL
jgi:hypothetical protein